MKAKLPRRESERRAHPLARHIDVLTGILIWFCPFQIFLTLKILPFIGIETRLSLLSMTYYKYTVVGVFCFIPGKVSLSIVPFHYYLILKQYVNFLGTR
jgi:F-box protein 28